MIRTKGVTVRREMTRTSRGIGVGIGADDNYGRVWGTILGRVISAIMSRGRICCRKSRANTRR
jgi:hypothetical protein